jgi:hypothetical protein
MSGLVAVLALCVATVASAQDATLPSRLRDAFEGHRPKAMVDELDHLWRWPGNRPYQQAVAIVERSLVEAGYIEESQSGPGERLTYRLERRPMSRPAWEPIDAALWIEGDAEPLLRFETNRNMIAINSGLTPEGGVSAELVSICGLDRSEIEGLDLDGAIVIGDGHPMQLRRAAGKAGAVGLLAYMTRDYNRPAEYREAIPFTSIRTGGWAVLLSTNARQTLLDRLDNGPVRVRVEIETRSYEGEDQTIIAEVRGSTVPEQRFVFSAHVQEPGANDNASGMACQAEMARVLAELLRAETIDPDRTITMLWGNEIQAIARYLDEDASRREGVRWGMSLDMVGEDTSKTGGTFLIEKMPDPSAIWTRGADEHTEWGAGRVDEDDLHPHYFNDLVLARCLEQAAAVRAADGVEWVVKTNPYEGGSDHVPFLRADLPGLLLWHFTDVYYHTDGDRAEMVSATTMENVGVSALATALLLAQPGEASAAQIVEETLAAGLARLHVEQALSEQAIADGGDEAEQRRIIEAWRAWYRGAVGSVMDVPLHEAGQVLLDRIERAQRQFGDPE